MVERPGHLTWAQTRTRPVVNAVLTRKGILDASGERWPDPRVELVVLGSPSLDGPAHEARFGATVETTGEPSIGWALERLAARGCRSVLIEGGGDFIFRCLAAGHLDEMFVTVCPLVIGGVGAPTPADGPGFEADDLRRLRLVSARHHDQEVFLHYKVESGNP